MKDSEGSNRWDRLPPVAEWTRGYNRELLEGDLRGGLTMGVVLVPQGMAYAVLAGLPPVYGLYAGLTPPVIYALFASARHLAVGPLAIDMLIVAAGVGVLAQGDPSRMVALSVALAGMVGIIQISMAAARLGFLVSLLARPVIVGFVWAAALIIGFSQVGNLTGMELPRSEYLAVMLWDLAGAVDGLHAPTLLIGAGSIAVLIFLRQFRTVLPGPLVVVLAGTLAVALLGLDQQGVAVVGDVAAGFPPLSFPVIGHEDVRDLLPTAITLALVQFMTLSSLGRVYGSRHGYRVDGNRELLAIGAANLAGSLFRSVPASASFSRSAVNEEAGARTPGANVVAAGVVLLTLLFLTPFFRQIPLAALGAIIVVAVSRFIRIREGRYLFRTKQRDGYLALFTFGVTLILGIREGILLGIAASTLALLYRMSRPHVEELGHLRGTRFFRDLTRTPRARPMESILLLRMDAGFSFLNADYLRGVLVERSRQTSRPIRALILDGIIINDLDTTAVEALEEATRELEAMGVELHLTGLIGRVRDVVRRSGLYELLGEDRFHRSPHQAVKYILQEWDRDEGSDRLEDYRRNVLREEPELEGEDLFGVRP